MNKEQLKKKVNLILCDEEITINEMLINIIQCADAYKNEKIIEKAKYGNDEPYTLLTTDILRGLNFKDNGKCQFNGFENMSYWVKNCICLFYNTPVSTDYQDHFYIGYAEMRQSKYVAVAFKWIDSLEELTQIYEGIVPTKIGSPN